MYRSRVQVKKSLEENGNNVSKRSNAGVCSPAKQELYGRGQCLRQRHRKYEEREGMVEWRHDIAGGVHARDNSQDHDRRTDGDTTVDSVVLSDAVPVSESHTDITSLSSTSSSSDEDSEDSEGGAGGKQSQGMMITTPDGHRLQPPAPPSFGNIVVKSSSDVHFGNKTFYNGPVTIKQVVYSNQSSIVSNTSNDASSSLKSPEESAGNGDVEVPCQSLQNGSAGLQHTKTSHYTDETLSHWLRKASKSRRCVALVALGTCATLVMVILVVIYFTRTTRTYGSSDLIDASEEDGANAIQYNGSVIPSGKLRIIKRREWLAQPPVHPADPLKHPVPYVIILHTATENCSTRAECVFLVRHIQTFHMESFGWWDIAYSFLIGGDTYVYEGRGWDGVGSFTYGYNNVSIGIAVIGTFITYKPNNTQIIACKQLINKGVQLGKIAPDYKLIAHRQVSGTESPGSKFYEEIKTWPHWVEKP